MDSLNLPEPIPPAEYSDLPEPVVSLSQLPEAVQRTGSRACAKDTELRKLSQSDAVATTGTDGSGPSEAQNITVQPSDTEGYQRLASPMKPDQTDGVAIVTPLRLLGDQSDFVDCPFCRRQVETRVEKSASKMTLWVFSFLSRPPAPRQTPVRFRPGAALLTYCIHSAIGTALCLTTFIAMWVPCYLKWYSNVDHYCGNCDRVLAHREYNKKEVEVYGTPEHLKEVSKYPAAPPRPVEEKAKQDSQHHQL